jgi:hypothetical protein
MQGFYGMRFNFSAGVEQLITSEPLLHSIYNTGKVNTKVALVPTGHYDEALTQLSAIHSILAASIRTEYHKNVVIDSLMAKITGQQIESISSCNSAAYATELLKT